MSTDTPEQTIEKVGLEETVESFTGFDEIAVEQQFGRALEDLKSLMSMRAAVFVLLRRSGAADRVAYQQAMEASMKAVQDHFTDFDEDAEIEVMPDEPETPAGKDGSQPDGPPTN